MLKINIPNIVIPAEGPKPLYYNTFVVYIRKMLDYLGINYKLSGKIPYGVSKFEMSVGGALIVFDFSDHHIDYWRNWKDYDAYFKFHYVEAMHGACEGIYPFAPVSFYDWGQYYSLKNEIQYSCNTNVILNMQRPGGAATERREYVQLMLANQYGSLAVTDPAPQVEYWKKINNCLTHVFVPGARNNMLDRAHIQYLAFGCCTIAPKITDVLPYYGELLPGEHYVECRDDYADLIDKIEWVRNNRSSAIEIGRNAKVFFEQTCTPEVIWNYVSYKLGLK